MSILEVCILWVLASVLGALTSIGTDLMLSLHGPRKREPKLKKSAITGWLCAVGVKAVILGAVWISGLPLTIWVTVGTLACVCLAAALVHIVKSYW